MKKKKKKMSVASKTRLFLSLIIFCSIIGSLSYNCYDNISKIYKWQNDYGYSAAFIISLGF